MKTKVYLCIAVGLVLFLLGGLIMSQVVTAQVKMQPNPMPTTRIVWDYDSGWVNIEPGENRTLTHNLGGDPGKYFVYVIGQDLDKWGILQTFYGGNNTADNKMKGLEWYLLNSANINVLRFEDDDFYDEMRIFILKNQ